MDDKIISGERRKVLKSVAAGAVGTPFVGTAAANQSRSGSSVSPGTPSVDPSEILKGKRIFREENVHEEGALPIPDVAEAVEDIGPADVAILRDKSSLSKETIVPEINDGMMVAFSGTRSANALQSMLGIHELSSDAEIREKLEPLDLLVAFNNNVQDIPLTVFAPSPEEGTLDTHYYNIPQTPTKIHEKVAKTAMLNEQPTRNPHKDVKQTQGGSH